MSTPTRDFDTFLHQKALAAMDLYRAAQSGIRGPKTKASYEQAKALWDAQIGAAAEPVGPQNPPPTPGKGFIGKPGRPIAEMITILASREVGVKEEGGNNRGAQIVEYQKATWLDPAPWPWCAAFVCWVVQEALKTTRAPHDFKRPRTAGAWDFERWAREDGGSKVTLIKPPRGFQPGDIICFTFSHIGIVEKTSPSSTSTVTTIEGNTGPSGGREGDGVWRKTRPVSKIRSVIRLGF